MEFYVVRFANGEVVRADAFGTARNRVLARHVDQIPDAETLPAEIWHDGRRLQRFGSWSDVRRTVGEYENGLDSPEDTGQAATG